MGISYKLHRRIRQALAVMTAAAVVGGAVLIGSAVTPDNSHAVSYKGYAKDCNNNSIIYCGASTTSQLYKKYKASSRAQHVYSAYGISRSDVANLGKTAIGGYATKNGNVYTSSGKLVATHAYSAGFNRQPHGSTHHSYRGTGYYNTASQNVFLSNKIHGWIVMKNGVFQFMILQSCGNPLKGKPTTKPKPKPSSLTCKSLSASQTSRNEFEYTVHAAKQNATITSYNINFGDGHTYHGKSASTKHAYARPGTYTVRASVTGKVHGKTVTRGGCDTKVTVKPKPASLACTSLSVDKHRENEYEYTVNIKQQNATDISYHIDFGDGNSYTGSANHATHTYEKSTVSSKTYTVKATVTGKLNGKTVTRGGCNASVTIPPEAANLACTSLSVKNLGNDEYEFTVNIEQKNATDISYYIDFGDGKSYQGTEKTVNHPYKELESGKTYTVKATVSGKVHGQMVTKGGCNASVTIPPKPTCPIPGKENFPPNSPECHEQPKELVNTGPGEIVGIFAATAIAGTFVSRLFLRRRYDS